jgi:hypothetical protein
LGTWEDESATAEFDNVGDDHIAVDVTRTPGVVIRSLANSGKDEKAWTA